MPGQTLALGTEPVLWSFEIRSLCLGPYPEVVRPKEAVFWELLVLYPTAQYSRVQLCAEGLFVGPELYSAPAGKSFAVLSVVWGYYRGKKSHQGLFFFRCCVSAELWHQVFALVTCKAGLCSVFLSQSPLGIQS